MVPTTARKIISLLFIFLGMSPWFFIIIFSIQQQWIRHEMKERLEENIPHHTIQIRDEDVSWARKGKEIRINGNLFDIKTWHSENGISSFTGIYDKEETRLEKQLELDWNKHAPQESKTLLQLLSMCSNIYFEQLTDKYEVVFEHMIYATHKPSLPSQFIGILTPPPRCLAVFEAKS